MDPLAPLTPPRAWFSDLPDWWDPDGPAIQIAMAGPDAGRVAVLVAPAGECLLNGSTDCWTVPQSPSGYRFAHIAGSVLTAEGDLIGVANIGGGVPHSQAADVGVAAHHYANTATRLLRVRYQDRPDGAPPGVYALGALDEHVTLDEAIRTASFTTSGHWCWVEEYGAYDMAGAQLVNNPGFRRTPALASARFVQLGGGAGDRHPPVMGGAAGPPPNTSTQEAPMAITIRTQDGTLITGEPTTGNPEAPCSCHAQTAAAEPTPPADGVATEVDQLRGQVSDLQETVANLENEVARLTLGEVIDEEISA